ncbi:hypothetical protein DUNSADRAFT_5087 [Dunaliella salina]|uniref:Encoded protein n=1 Tax=Dunaliella salina TaxID=3046 RepID=A0ABQ7HAG7_DUNSA|nr:hypothetical protein DUNSADRAFT_5087 [Dunaliella salina]|eukprot:KAF5843849.1 hypothetical protein DUNSADRAFT_5087 [Dunaliella salina]
MSAIPSWRQRQLPPPIQSQLRSPLILLGQTTCWATLVLHELKLHFPPGPFLPIPLDQPQVCLTQQGPPLG